MSLGEDLPRVGMLDLRDLMLHKCSDLHGITECHLPLMSFTVGPFWHLDAEALGWCPKCFASSAGATDS